MYLPRPSEGGDFTPPPAGTFPAICYRIVDLGTQATSFKGEEKHLHKVMLSWELKGDETIMDDGRPMTIHQRYTWSMHEKATLRRQLEAWLGRKFVDADFGPGGFDIRKLLGMGCLISVMHDEGKNGSIFANVASVTKLPKGMQAGSLFNETAFLFLTPEGFNPAVFEALSDSLKTTIKKSPEYQRLFGDKPKPVNGGKPANTYKAQSQSSNWPDAMPGDDDIERWGPPR
jgi:hypothetical protein